MIVAMIMITITIILVAINNKITYQLFLSTLYYMIYKYNIIYIYVYLYISPGVRVTRSFYTSASQLEALGARIDCKTYDTNRHNSTKIYNSTNIISEFVKE